MKRELGKRLEKVRESRNMTREEAAEKAGISTKFLYEVERGKKGVSAETLLKLARTLSVSCDYLLTGEEAAETKKEREAEITRMFDKKQMELIEEILHLIYEISNNKA